VTNLKHETFAPFGELRLHPLEVSFLHLTAKSLQPPAKSVH